MNKYTAEGDKFYEIHDTTYQEVGNKSSEQIPNLSNLEGNEALSDIVQATGIVETSFHKPVTNENPKNQGFSNDVTVNFTEDVAIIDISDDESEVLPKELMQRGDNLNLSYNQLQILPTFKQPTLIAVLIHV